MLHVRRGYGDQCEIYRSIQEIRSDVSSKVQFDFDRYSHHYLLYSDDTAVGCVSVHHASEGELDCEAFYPPHLRVHFEDRLFTCCKLRIRPNGVLPMEGLRLIVRDLWTEQLSLGRRVAVINATDKLIRFYRWMGFTALQGCDFIHPVLQTHSHVMVMAADPAQRSICRDLYTTVPDRVSQSQIVAECTASVSAMVA